MRERLQVGTDTRSTHRILDSFLALLSGQQDYQYTVVFGSSPRDIYLVLPGVELLTSNNLDIISARDEYLRAYPPAAQQLCMIYAPRHMFLWIK